MGKVRMQMVMSRANGRWRESNSTAAALLANEGWRQWIFLSQKAGGKMNITVS